MSIKLLLEHPWLLQQPWLLNSGLLDPITHVAVLGAALGLGFLGSMILWLAAEKKARAARETFERFRVSTDAKIAELSARVDAIRDRPVADPVLAAGFMAVQGLNLTNRTKALRMYRRGESVASIAGALGVQQEEIDLLLKLDRLLEMPAA
jgi:hypothetical protein